MGVACHWLTQSQVHIFNYMHPQAIIIDSPANEEAWFLKGLRKKQAAITPMPIIELPAQGTEKLSWMAKLDSQSLKGMGCQEKPDFVLHEERLF